mgnify:CR=1 FL=1
MSKDGLKDKEINESKIVREREVYGIAKYVFVVAAIAIAVYEICFLLGFNYALYSVLAKYGIVIEALSVVFDTQQGQAFVLAMILIMAFLLYPVRRKPSYFRKIPVYDGVLASLGAVSTLYIFYIFPELIIRAGIVKPLDVVFGIICIILVLEATRRVIGPALTIIATAFLLYGLLFVKFDLKAFIDHMYLAKEGLFSIPLFVMVTYVFAFVFFGSFLLRIGVGRYITEFMISAFGSRSGGPAKSAVVASALMGTVSGSSVANVLTTGTFTIPLMRRSGYPPEIAGAIEPTASTGGQIMPPIMGAAAFIMAEFLGRPYRDIMIAGVIPALIYYSGVYAFIDLETKRLGLKPIPRVAPLKQFLKKIYMLVPIPLIAYELLIGIPPQYAAISSLSVALLAAWIAQEDIKPTIKFAFISVFSALMLGMYFTGIMLEQILVLSGVIAILLSVLIGLLAKEARLMSRATIEAVIDASRISISVMLAATVAGMIQGVLTLTGLITSFGYMLVDLVAGNLLALLVIAMTFSLILGMGVPTTANYVITSLVCAPAVVLAATQWYGIDIKVAMLAAHMFVFYFGILADVTPPVALAAYAGSALARSEFWRTAINAAKYALAGYVGPYIFFTHPEMLLVTVSEWNIEIMLYVIYCFAASLLAIYLLAVSITGWLSGPLPKYVRVILGVLGICGVSLNYIVAIVGFTALITIYIMRRIASPSSGKT